MKSILIIGALGMLGSQVLKEFSKTKYKIYATYRNNIDLNKFKKNENNKKFKVVFYKFDIKNYKKKDLKKIIYKKDFIINCAGVIKPYINEDDFHSVENAIQINSIFPHFLNSAAKKFNTRIYQIATDCVFSGLKGNYTENDNHDAVDVYGKTKSLGEVKSANFFNLRCSIIGHELKNNKSLIEWFKNSKKGSTLKGFNDHLWNGITTNAFAKIVRSIIENDIQIPNNLHIIPKDKVTKYELLNFFKFFFKRDDLNIIKTKSSQTVTRTLKTKHVKKNLEIWKKSLYFAVKKIEKLVEEIK
jgi:dTDP-4-dehydrorhamnose reductase